MAGSEQVIKNLYKWATMKKAGIEGVTLTTEANMTTYARTNCRWNSGPPNTGNARAGLHGGHFWENPDILKIYIAHAMSYGVYLELAHDRKYQILEEARDKFKDSWFKSVKRIMES
jgi:hypothetical protein